MTGFYVFLLIACVFMIATSYFLYRTRRSQLVRIPKIAILALSWASLASFALAHCLLPRGVMFSLGLVTLVSLSSVINVVNIIETTEILSKEENNSKEKIATKWVYSFCYCFTIIIYALEVLHTI